MISSFVIDERSQIGVTYEGNAMMGCEFDGETKLVKTGEAPTTRPPLAADVGGVFIDRSCEDE